jgi:hypothetical protein
MGIGRERMYSGLLKELQKMIVDGDEVVFTLCGVDEYLHPSSTETELEPEGAQILEENEG